LQAVEREANALAPNEFAASEFTDKDFADQDFVNKEFAKNGFGHFQSLPVSLPPDNKLVCLTAPESLGAEKFRFLAVRLRQLQQSRPLKKVLITSAIPEEGKSTIGANLAVILAKKKQHKVLLLEGDLRRPTLSKEFGLGRIPGLSEWLQGAPRPIEHIYHLEGPNSNLWFLPAGLPPESPLELMQSGRLSELMDQLATWFDWIIIDSPPILPLADTSVWARLADGILLITREGTTKKRLLQRGLQALKQSKLLGVVLNSSANADHAHYYQCYGPGAARQADVREE
jgi:capsular exopolysaccharide synthesis family protein